MLGPSFSLCICHEILILHNFEVDFYNVIRTLTPEHSRKRLTLQIIPELSGAEGEGYIEAQVSPEKHRKVKNDVCTVTVFIFFPDPKRGTEKYSKSRKE